MKAIHKSCDKSQSGNVLWLILIAIALLGALTLILSRSGSNVEQNASIERLEIQASQIMRYASGLEAAVQQLLLRGCSENEISFESTATGTTYQNTNSPIDNTCHVFESEGAGLAWRTFTSGTIPGGVFTSQGISNDAAISEVGTSAADVLFIVKIDVAQCSVINNKFGIDDSNPNNISSDSLDIMDNPTKGSYTGSVAIGIVGEAINIAGRPSGCFIMDTGDYLFYHAILVR